MDYQRMTRTMTLANAEQAFKEVSRNRDGENMDREHEATIYFTIGTCFFGLGFGTVWE